MSLREHWEEHALDWARWARAPDHDSYWRFSGPTFLELVPQPGRLTLDISCGEGRLARDLAARGHRVIGVDAPPTLVRLAREADESIEFHVADAANLPLEDGIADPVVAFMSLMDIEDMPSAVGEAARVLEPAGRFCFAIVHPINSAGSFVERRAESPFVIEGSYLKTFRYAERFERNGIEMLFSSMHRPLEAYTRALEDAGFLIEAIREPALDETAYKDAESARWRRVPLFLYVRARRRD